MDIVLIPGFWLPASSWAPVTEALRAAGHTPHPVTPLGAGGAADEVAAITLADQAAAVAETIDALEGPVVVVGHSGGGAVAHAVADARPERVARVVYVDSGPLGEGGVVNDELPVTDGVVPMPERGLFEEEELAGLSEELWERLRADSLSVPPLVASGPQHLHDERRYAVPVTIITSTMPEAVLRDLIAKEHPYVAELARIEQVDYVEVPTGHWPQYSRPDDLAAAVVRAVDATVA
jgi:pimeloyl-ACP methyl ester carboxylesterase